MRVNLGVIGTGSAFRRLHLPVLQKMPEDFRVVALANRTRAKAEAVHERAIDVVSPDGREGTHVARHTRHESGDECSYTETEQTGAAVTCQHQGKNFVVAMAATRDRCGLAR